MTSASVAAGIRRTAARAGAVVACHATPLGGGREVAVGADRPVALASVFKVAVLLEMARQASDGTLDPSRPVEVAPGPRTAGATGLSVLEDRAVLSVRDLAVLMISISDNHATDLLLDLVGLDAVNRTLDGLGLRATTLVGDTAALLRTLADDVGAPSPERIGDHLRGLAPADASARVAGSRAMRPSETTRSTPREMTGLLRAIWRDEAAAPRACAEVRRVLGLQAWPHRIRSGFPDEASVSGKTGTLDLIRNEVAVVEDGAGNGYAVGVFLVTRSADEVQPQADRAIARIARLAVDALGGASGHAARRHA